jgi:hypothetical protein
MYSNNDPVNWIDPDGLDPKPDQSNWKDVEDLFKGWGKSWAKDGAKNWFNGPASPEYLPS